MSGPGEMDAPLFHEPGGRWRTVAVGPVLCAVALVVELFTGPVVHWLALPVLAVVLAGFAYVMIVAARRHVSVELTAEVLRQGTEELPLAEIEAVLPPPTDPWEPQRWETARSLGELADVPRGRTAIGLRLRGGALVRAWAKDAETLRARLDALVAGRGTPGGYIRRGHPRKEPLVQNTYRVEGMTCGHCVAAVKEEVGALATVTAVDVDLETGRLVVDSGGDLDRAAVAAAVDEAGYTLAP